MRQPSAEVFLKDVRRHSMTVLHNDGLYRHLHFSKPADNNMWFDIVTWPWNLTIHGDMGTWVFMRVEDMFGFFRHQILHINPKYWAEKIENGSNGGGRDNAMEFDEELFAKGLLDHVKLYCDDCEIVGDDAKAFVDAVKEEILIHDNEDVIRSAASEFKYKFADGSTFEFDSSDLPSGMDYEYHFIWCCYAIVWAIQQWDAAQSVTVEKPNA